MKRSKIGRAIVAVRMDSAAAALMGIKVHSIYAITFGIGALMAGATGAIFAMVYPVTTNLSGAYLGKVRLNYAAGHVTGVVNTLSSLARTLAARSQ